MNSELSPAEMSSSAGVSIDTLRYYEREGLIGPVQRDAGGRRRYDADDVFWIGLVTCLRDAGLGIADLRDFTSLLRSPAAAHDRTAFLRQHRQALEARRQKIDVALSVLDEKIAHYAAEEPDSPA